MQIQQPNIYLSRIIHQLFLMDSVLLRCIDMLQKFCKVKHHLSKNALTRFHLLIQKLKLTASIIRTQHFNNQF